MKKKNTYWVLLLIFFIASCSKDGTYFSTIEDDKALGAQVAEEIASDPTQYPLLDEAAYPFAYNYIRNLTNTILASEEIKYRNEFVWQVKIIRDDNTLNAFVTPGGYIYVYTGLIKYLDKEDDLAGVLGHEIAHAELRHSMRQLERVYGLQIILSTILGNNPGQITQIAGALAGNLAVLQFSRSAETEADAYSVTYLSQTPYQCNGAYSFFQKLIDSDQAGNTPVFLSTHPNPADRVEEINAKAQAIGCDTTPYAPASYQDFKASLP